MFRFVEVAILSSFTILWLTTRVTRRLPLVEQELHTIPQHTSSLSVFLWGSRSSIFSFLCSVLQIIVCSFFLFSFDQCIVCPSPMYVLRYLQTFLWSSHKIHYDEIFFLRCASHSFKTAFCSYPDYGYVVKLLWINMIIQERRRLSFY
jgi:hypothetical protein